MYNTDRPDYRHRDRVNYKPRISNSYQNQFDLHQYRMDKTSYASDEMLFKVKGKIVQVHDDHIVINTKVNEDVKINIDQQLGLTPGLLLEIEGVIRQSGYVSKIITIFLS